jgi:hypothetical protein
MHIIKVNATEWKHMVGKTGKRERCGEPTCRCIRLELRHDAKQGRSMVQGNLCCKGDPIDVITDGILSQNMGKLTFRSATSSQTISSARSQQRSLIDQLDQFHCLHTCRDRKIL